MAEARDGPVGKVQCGRVQFNIDLVDVALQESIIVYGAQVRQQLGPKASPGATAKEAVVVAERARRLVGVFGGEECGDRTAGRGVPTRVLEILGQPL